MVKTVELRSMSFSRLITFTEDSCDKELEMSLFARDNAEKPCTSTMEVVLFSVVFVQR